MAADVPYVQQTPRLDALQALSGWSDRDGRGELVAEAWRTGTRNATLLAGVAGVDRDEIYRQLGAAGVDWTDPDAAAAARPEAATAGEVAEIARRAAEVFGPAVECGDPGPLTTVTWQLSTAYGAIAELLADGTDAEAMAEAERELVERLRIGLHHALIHQASRHTPRDALALTHEALGHGSVRAGDATVSLLPDGGEPVTVRLSLDPATGGPVVPYSDSPLLDTTALETRDQLELLAALDTIAEVLGRHLATGGGR